MNLKCSAFVDVILMRAVEPGKEMKAKRRTVVRKTWCTDMRNGEK